jgi:hypothetical protein
MPRPEPTRHEATLFYRDPDGQLWKATGYGETEPDAQADAMRRLDGVFRGPISTALQPDSLTPWEQRTARLAPPPTGGDY